MEWLENGGGVEATTRDLGSEPSILDSQVNRPVSSAVQAVTLQGWLQAFTGLRNAVMAGIDGGLITQGPWVLAVWDWLVVVAGMHSTWQARAPNGLPPCTNTSTP